MYARLPARVASHFGPSGAPNGWMPRELFVGIYVFVVVLLGAMMLGTAYTLPRTPDNRVNLPHKEYWLAPERRAETYAWLQNFFFWSGMVWTSLKIPLTALKAASLSAEIRAIAIALVVSFSGIAVGIFFLSFTYKQLLFVWFGLSGAFYGIMQETDPTLRVKVGWKDCAGVVLANVGIIGLLWAYTRARGN